MNSGFFISELINALKNNSKFITDKIDIIRDYVHPSDLFSIVKKCIFNKKINDVFDVYSSLPISKFKILEELSQIYDLKFVVKEKIDYVSPTGIKKKYYSRSRKATKINYQPKYSSLETILKETEFIVNRHTLNEKR